MYLSQSYDNVDRIILFTKYKLVEKTEPEVNPVWKGAHLLLFFLAFVFGSFCTFCFQMLMYLFDEKCVLFPKLLSLSSFRQNIIYEFIPEDKDTANMVPVDFLSAQWVEQSTCLLPTYVPLVSGIFGLVWTTMFLMCSSGSRILTGLQRPWRVLPAVFLFSIVMGSVCVYTSAFTHYGLQELCHKLTEITGSTTCSYTINVATLAYQRRIRGLYQATRLTIASAWLHTACWVLSALLALVRVLLAVDFKLVQVKVELQGNIDRMLERYERQISTVTPSWADFRRSNPQCSQSGIRIHFIKDLQSKFVDRNEDGDLLHYKDLPQEVSELALVSTERQKLDRRNAIHAVPKDYQFIAIIVYNLLDTVYASEPIEISSGTSSSESISDVLSWPIFRQYGQQKISSKLAFRHSIKPDKITSADIRQATEMAKELKRKLNSSYSNRDPNELKLIHTNTLNLSSEMQNVSVDRGNVPTLPLSTDIDSELGTSTVKKKALKSNLKTTGVQTDEKAKDKSLKVLIIESHTDLSDSDTSRNKDNQDSKKTQTKKEKQD